MIVTHAGFGNGRRTISHVRVTFVSRLSLFLSLCNSMYVYVCMCENRLICVRVCVRASSYLCNCVCVCVCDWVENVYSLIMRYQI